MDSPDIQNSEVKPKRDYLLPISVLIAAVLIAGALIYNSGKQATGPGTANLNGNVAQASLISNVKPVSSTDHILGDPSAPIKIIEFSDLECPFCKEFQSTLHSIVQTYGSKVAWIFRNYPIPQLHPKSPHEAQAAECAAKLGGNDVYWKYIDGIFAITPSNNGLDPAELPQMATQVGLDATQFNSCLNSTYGQDIVSADSQEAISAGGQGTPFSVVVVDNGLSASMVSLLNSLNQQYPSNPPLFQISQDNKMFSIGGAIPLQLMTQIFDQLVKT